MDRFADLIGSYIPEPDKVMDHVFGRRFAISSAIRKSIQDIGQLESIHGGLEHVLPSADIRAILLLFLLIMIAGLDHQFRPVFFFKPAIVFFAFISAASLVLGAKNGD